jgi:hypothetical protein
MAIRNVTSGCALDRPVMRSDGRLFVSVAYAAQLTASDPQRLLQAMQTGATFAGHQWRAPTRREILDAFGE